jgi:hypothetical protein
VTCFGQRFRQLRQTKPVPTGLMLVNLVPDSGEQKLVGKMVQKAKHMKREVAAKSPHLVKHGIRFVQDWEDYWPLVCCPIISTK